MNTRKLTALAAAATMAIGASAVGTAQARHGADDPAGHQRHGADDAQPHAKRAHKHHHHHRGHHRRNGADDGANHT
jgi:hypothetical protein